MAFSRRIATLAAVVAIPLSIAATSYALTDNSEPSKAPPKVELDSGSSSATPSDAPSTAPATSTPTPGDEVVKRPPVSEGASGSGDDDDDGGASSGAGDSDDD
ncbi:small secreted hydrophilic protein [Streptomyces sp. T-3]|nr:small secreted hydrophilic protein [Streptomyces sp. T-3]